MLVTGEGDGTTPPVEIPYADVASGDVNALYTRVAPDGTSTSDQLTGMSLSEVVQAASVPPGSVSYVEISARSGRVTAVSGSDLAVPSPFPDGTVPAVYTAADNTLGYITPSRPVGQPNDYDTAKTGDPIFVTVHTTGRLLSPSVAVDDDSVDTGSAVLFAATFGSDPGTTIDYTWDFGDGSTVSGGASESHSYAAAGVYQARLTVHGADGSLGIARSELITVGTPAPPTNSAGTGSGQATATPAPTVGSTKSAGPTSHPTSKSSAHPTSKPSVAATAEPTATSTPRAPATSVPSSTPAPLSTSTTTPVEPVAGTPVAGILISGEATAAETPSSGTPSSPPTAARAGSRAALGWGSAAVAGTVVLLGAGMLLESGMLGGLLARLKRRIR